MVTNPQTQIEITLASQSSCLIPIISNNIKTLCVDEKTLHSILKKCRSDYEKSSMWENIQKRLFDKLEYGSYKGYIIVAI